jgi:hypothetical protein
LIDVFFRGAGYWVNVDGDPEDPYFYGINLTTQPITQTYQVSGVFSLNKQDEITYKHTKKFKHVNSLLPSTHSDDEFSKILSQDVIGEVSEMYPNFIFKIDTSQPQDELVIAEPDKLPNHLKTETTENERDIMCRLIICMAIDAYGYDPASNKNSATGKNHGSIKAAVEKQGLIGDEKTIKKYLDEAAKRYPDAKPVKH